MKILRILFLLLSINTLFAQNVTVTPWGITPQQNSAIPKLTYDAILQMVALEGDMAYDLTFHCLRAYNGQKWVCTNQNSSDVPNISIIATGTNANAPAMAVDNNSNLYLGGSFNSNITLSNKNNFPSQTLGSSGLSDFYIAKYDYQGWLLWAKKFGNTNNDGVTKIKTDYAGNIIVSGYFGGTVDFGGISKTATGDTDAFFVKYSSSGNLIWVKTISGSDSKTINGLAIDSNGNIFIGGYFEGTVSFDGSIRTSAGGFDAFFAKYNENGNTELIKIMSGTSSETVEDLELDNWGSICLTGRFAGSTSFDNTTSKTSAGLDDMFVGKYDGSGNLLWVKTAGGTGNDAGRALVIDSWGTVYVSGYFTGTATFDSTPKTSLGQNDIFFASYNSGLLASLSTFGGAEDDFVNDMIIDSGDNIYLTGTFKATCTFYNVSKTSKGLSDIFVWKMGQSGWVQTYGGSTNDSGNYLTIDNSGNVFNSGYFAGSLFIGGIKYEVYPRPMYILRIEK